MAKWTDAVSVSFNDNDGKIGCTINPEGAKDFHRYQRIFGKYRTRWIMLKWFWKGLMRAESMNKESLKAWVFKASIPE